MAFLWKLTGLGQQIFDVSIVLPKHFVGMLLHDGQNVPDIEVRPEASALIYTMVEMARANGVNVYQYLTYLLENVRPARPPTRNWRSWLPGIRK